MPTELDEVAIPIFDGDEDAARDALASLDQDAWQSVQINLIECLMAEGSILVKKEFQRVSELLLGPRGPLLTVGQRAWLEQLARRPLRLHDLTDVVPGVGVTVGDALAGDSVKFQRCEVFDPKDVIARALPQSTQKWQTSAMPEGFDANTPGHFIETATLGRAGSAALTRC